MTRITAGLIAVVMLLSVGMTMLWIDGAKSSIQVVFADDQTAIFYEMQIKAEESLRRSPPDVQSAVESLQYVHSYYPSGTKQKTGSRLDRIVERTRLIAESRIIQQLQEVTGEELGNEVEEWSRKFGKERDVRNQ